MRPPDVSGKTSGFSPPSLLSGLGGGSGGGIFGSLLGAFGSALGGLFGVGGPTMAPAPLFSGIYARGGAFDRAGEVTAFARGGVVTRPMVFPFARGIGLMGEAGPEAILPLRRGPGGRLGVEAGGMGESPAPVTRIINVLDPAILGDYLATPAGERDGLLLATILSGFMLAAIGLLQLGTYIKFIPYPVTVGFTAGIAVIIFASQIKELLGLTLAGTEPGPLVEKLPVLWSSLPTADPATLALAAATIGAIVGLKRVRPGWPGMLIAVAGADLATVAMDLPVATIGTKFGGIPSSLPLPVLPEISMAKVSAVLPSALAFTLLGSIESLLSAVVADGMTGRRHRSNCELVAQGAANVASGV